MNMCGHKNNGWAEDASYKYAGGLGMGAMGNTNTGNGGISGSSLGEQYNVTNPFAPPPPPVCPDLSPDYTGGVTYNACNINTPVDTTMAKNNAAWDALKASIDSIISACTTPAATTGATTPASGQNIVAKSTNTLWYVAGGGVVVVILAGIIISKINKGKNTSKS